MKKHTCAVFAAAALGASLAMAQAGKPNILFLFADDLCHDSIRALGNEEIHTPNLDKLVSQGMTFTQAYNMGSWTGAVCMASRQMLNSGRFVWHCRDEEYSQGGRLWSQQMKKAGYTTYMAGKWHVSTKAETIFDKTGSVRGGMPRQTKEGYGRPGNENDKDWLPWDRSRGGFWEGGKHWSEVLCDETIGFLEQAAEDDKPFFIYCAFNAPHDPRQSPKEFVEMYPLDKISVPPNFRPKYEHADQIGCQEKQRDEKLAPFPRTEYAVKVNRQEYYAIITHMDAQIGKILAKLEETGKAGNTYIFFTADHGLAVGHHGLLGKQNLYEHSLRPPFLVVGPGVEPGSKSSTRIYLQDVMPTTLELAGIGRPDYVEFKSLLPFMRGENPPHYAVIYGAYMGLQRAVIKGDYKLIHYPKAGNTYRLFNLRKDRYEMNDLIGNPEYAAKAAELKRELAALQLAMDDPMVGGREEKK